MPLQSGIYPSTTVSFTVKNNSSINRAIKVFGVKINPGGTLDLMTVPGVTEEDIRSELTKGSLKSLFAGKSLTVVNSTINFSSSDTAHQQFLNSIGLSGFATNPALLQTVWFISFLTGSDSNDGLTASTPLKTFTEWFRRLGGPVVTFSKATNPGVTVTVLDHDISDTITGKEIHCLGGFVITFQGGPTTTVSTGTYTSVTVKNIATNTPPQVTDTGVTTWPVRSRKKTTSGTRLGNVDWILKDLGGGSARCTDATINGSINSHQVGDTYAVETLPRMYIGTLQVFSENIVTQPISFSDLDLAFGSSSGPLGNANWTARRCRIGSYGNNFFNVGPYSGLNITTCLLDSIQINYTGLGAAFSGGNAGGGYGVPGAGHGTALGFAGTTQIGNFIGQNFTWLLGLGSSNRVSNIANFDQVADSINPNGDGMLIGIFIPSQEMCILQMNNGQIWGSGHAGHGLAFDGNSVLSYPIGTYPVITGTLGDFRLGPSLTTDTKGVFIDGISGSTSLPISCTWANLAAAQPTGFGGNAHNLAKNIHVIGRTTAAPTAALASLAAPVYQGTANTQLSAPSSFMGRARTTDAATPTLLATIPVPTGAIVTISFIGNARDVTAGTVGDGFSKQILWQFKNIAGTVTAASTNGVSPATVFDTSMSTCAVAATASGTNVVINVQGIAGVTIDWTGLFNVLTS